MIDHTTYPDRVREALAGTTPGEWEASPYTGRVMRCRKPHEDLTVGLQIVATAESDADAALIAESPTLAAAYLDLVAQFERARRVLAVEQGDDSAGNPPRGWSHSLDLTDEAGATIRHVWTSPAGEVYGSPYEGWWFTKVRGLYRDNQPFHETALEAMEAADAAQEPTP